MPNNRDCWYCLMHDKEGNSLGDNTDHIISHLDEMYVHGSLILNALKWKGYLNPEIIWHMDARSCIVGAVRAYLKRQLELV